MGRGDRIKAGRRPACSRPDCGVNTTQARSPRSGTSLTRPRRPPGATSRRRRSPADPPVASRPPTARACMRSLGADRSVSPSMTRSTGPHSAHLQARHGSLRQPDRQAVAPLGYPCPHCFVISPLCDLQCISFGSALQCFGAPTNGKDTTTADAHRDVVSGGVLRRTTRSRSSAKHAGKTPRADEPLRRRTSSPTIS